MRRYLIRFISGRFHPFITDFVRPEPVWLQVKISIRFSCIFVDIRGGFNRKISVLLTFRSGIDSIFHGKCFQKLILQEIPVFAAKFQVKGISQEVVFSGIFVHAAHQIRNSIEKMFVFYYRCVQNDLLLETAHHAGQVIGHSFEHFEGNMLLYTVFLSQQVGIPDGEKIMRSNSQLHHAGIFGDHCFIQNVQIISIHFHFAVVNRIFPSTQR